ncbi:MAG: YbaK/EbsC family protein [Oscillospiraceae bacterium]|nr:YbaK/EbsC family protein [Oscillospiraceae bacterium]
MSIEKGRAYFRQFGLEDRVREFDVSSATVELAALAVGVEGARIAKTLSFKMDDSCILILAAGDARIDNRKFKDYFHVKAKMPTADEVLELVGHPVGGVCPFGINEGISVYLDESLRRFETVFPAVGSGNSAIELNLEELYKYSNAVAWIDVCKLPEPSAE